MAHELQLIKQSSGILIPATPETSDILQSKIKLGAVLVAEFRQVRNPAFHRRFFALLNLGFEYWEPTGGTISANERKLVNGYAKFLAAYGGNESALLDAAEQYLEQIANRRVTNGISLCKSFDAYRAWVTVEAGHYDAIQLTKQCSTPRQRFHGTRSVMRLLKMKSCVKRLMIYVPLRNQILIPAPSTMSATA